MNEREEKQRIRFDDEWSLTNPHFQPLHDALWAARYRLKHLTQTQAYLICAAAEDYLHFVGHTATTKSIISQLRRMRRAVK